jgi:hypothetical protein
MLPNDDLARWGEPPTNDAELVLADLLADELNRLREGVAPAGLPASSAPETRARMSGSGQDLLETSDWIEELVSTVLTHSGVLDIPPAPSDTDKPSASSIDLRLRVFRVMGPSQYQPVASTHGRPTVLRDMRRVPDDPERVTLRTGDRVRIEVCCDKEGYITVLNVGPEGTVNLLYPDPQRHAALVRPQTPLLIADVKMTPPAGRERLYAVWSRTSLAVGQLCDLIGPGPALRDMRRVQDKLAEMRPEDWHAVMLELEHIGGAGSFPDS